MACAELLEIDVIGWRGGHGQQQGRRLLGISPIASTLLACLAHLAAEIDDLLSQPGGLPPCQGGTAGIGEHQPHCLANLLQGGGQAQGRGQQPQSLEAPVHTPAAAGLAGQGGQQGLQGLGLGAAQIGGKHGVGPTGATLRGRSQALAGPFQGWRHPHQIMRAEPGPQAQPQA